jgi:hypothetical protein
VAKANEGETMDMKRVAIIIGHAAVGWALCGAVIWIGKAIATMETALIAHAMAVPCIFAGVTWGYFKRFAYTSPLQTAGVFLAVVVCLDFFLVALLMERNLAMFRSVIGTWVPFGLIFASTYVTGILSQTDYKSNATCRDSNPFRPI